VSIKLVLLSHALVVDPDADAPSAVSVTPRKRRNSLKMWMDLCLVENIAAVRKVSDAAEESVASMTRRVSYGAGRDVGRHVFVVSTERPAAQEFRFDAASEEDREEWVRCLLLAKKLQSVNGGAHGSASTAEAAAADAANQLGTRRGYCLCGWSPTDGTFRWSGSVLPVRIEWVGGQRLGCGEHAAAGVDACVVVAAAAQHSVGPERVQGVGRQSNPLMLVFASRPRASWPREVQASSSLTLVCARLSCCNSTILPASHL